MSEIVQVMKKFADFHKAKGASPEEIRDAETALAIRFAEEYKAYLAECGIATADGHEFTGITLSGRLNVVDATQRAKENNENIPADFYVIEELQIDGIVIWQDAEGNIYESIRKSSAQLIAQSISSYILANEMISS